MFGYYIPKPANRDKSKPNFALGFARYGKRLSQELRNLDLRSTYWITDRRKRNISHTELIAYSNKVRERKSKSVRLGVQPYRLLYTH